MRTFDCFVSYEPKGIPISLLLQQFQLKVSFVSQSIKKKQRTMLSITLTLSRWVFFFFLPLTIFNLLTFFF